MSVMFNEIENVKFWDNDDNLADFIVLDEISSWQNSQISNSLKSLISSMKPTFLPSSKNLRQVFLSDLTISNPMFLLAWWYESLLFGLGFSGFVSGGKNYSFCSDLRILFSQKNFLLAWIITEKIDNFPLFLAILETLDFPIIYTNKQNYENLKKICEENFFNKIKIQIFGENFSIKLWNFSIFNEKNFLNVNYFENKIIYDFSDNNQEKIILNSEKNFIFKDKNFYYFNENKFLNWEIIEFDKNFATKNKFKFSLDNMILDGKTFGIFSDNILQDRKKMSDGGIIFINLAQSEQLHTIIGKIFVESRGFSHFYEKNFLHKEIIKKTRQIYENSLLDFPKISTENLKEIIEHRIEDFVSELTGRNPLIIVNIAFKNF